jgi:hypothetical protein
MLGEGVPGNGITAALTPKEPAVVAAGPGVGERRVAGQVAPRHIDAVEVRVAMEGGQPGMRAPQGERLGTGRLAVGDSDEVDVTHASAEVVQCHRADQIQGLHQPGSLDIHRVEVGIDHLPYQRVHRLHDRHPNPSAGPAPDGWIRGS